MSVADLLRTRGEDLLKTNRLLNRMPTTDSSRSTSSSSSDSAPLEEASARFSAMSLVSADEGGLGLIPRSVGQKVLRTTTARVLPGAVAEPELSRFDSNMTTEDHLASMYDDEPTSAGEGCPEFTHLQNSIWDDLDDLDHQPSHHHHHHSRPADLWKGNRPAFGQQSAQQWKTQRHHAPVGYPTPPGFGSAAMFRHQQAKHHQHRNAGPKEIPEHLKGKRLLGRALWFANKMGFGFIQHEGQDYFVHYTDIQMKGWRSLSPDDEVEFELENQGGRIKAVRVTGKGGKTRERPKTEQRAIKVCAQDLKGMCRRGAACRFTHIADLQPRHSMSMGHMPPMRSHHREMPYMPHSAPPQFC